MSRPAKTLKVEEIVEQRHQLFDLYEDIEYLIKTGYLEATLDEQTQQFRYSVTRPVERGTE